MIKLYVSGSTLSSRKTKAWLIQHNLSFEEFDLTTSQLSREDFNLLLSLTETGIDDLISTRSRIYKKLNANWADFTLSQIFELVNEHPVLLKKPLIFDENKLQIGFNSDDIRMFLPKEFRIAEKNLFVDSDTY